MHEFACESAYYTPDLFTCEMSFLGADATLHVLGLIRHFKQVLFYSNGQFDYRPMC